MLNLLMTENAFIYLDQRKFIVVEIIYPGREGEREREMSATNKQFSSLTITSTLIIR